uniref:Solute carrier family 22 member 25 n=1 Tax=Saimiri boliviensis boliviensis TaxID=39432 RepID=A0A2K6THX5_SAIBB
MAFQDLLNQVRGLGRFQILQMVFLIMFSIIVYHHTRLENFTTFTPDHRCWVHILDNDTVPDNNSGTLSQDALLRISIPFDSNLRPEKCRRFVRPQWHLLHLNGTFPNTSEPDTEPCVDGWVYDQTSFPSTIVTKWNLVCDAQSLNSVAKFLFMAGMMVGGNLYGHLSDRFGRKLVLRWCYLQLAIVGTCAAFAPTILVYCSLRFLAGTATIGIFTNTILLIVEWTPHQFHVMALTLMLCASGIGPITLGGLAFVIRDQQILQLVMSAPCFVFSLFSGWLAESARWLIINNKPEEGLKELRKIAHRNGIKNAEGILTMEVLRSAMKHELEDAQKKYSLGELLRMPNICKRICILSFGRFANTLPFWGFNLHLQHLGNDIFLLQTLFGVVILLAICVAPWALKHMNRRVSQMFLLSLLSVCTLAIIFVPQEMQTLRVVFAVVGLGASALANTIGIAQGNELIPSIIRGRSMGITSTFGNIGAALSPLVIILSIYSPSLPWIIYGVFPILSGLVILLLPETRNKPLPDSIQDVENEKRCSRRAGQEDTCSTVTRF